LPSAASRSKISAGSEKARPIDPSNHKTSFEHQALDSGKNEIRLIQLLPARKFDGVACGIECRIVHVSLDDSPVYDALSYVWGERKDLTSITVEGLPFPVTANLHGPLSRLQSSVTRLIWVDAICINQNDLVERSKQVVKMGDIFKQAREVIVWLGDGDKYSKLGFELLHELRDRNREGRPFREIVTDQRYLDYFYGIYQLFYRDYWWRVWVIQEVNLAKTATILCGRDSISWSELVSIQEILVTYHLRDLDDAAYFRSELSFLRTSIESRGPRAMRIATTQSPSELPDLAQTLLSHRFKEASDPRDMVYSLIGFSNAQKDPRFVMDYSKSVCEVYTDVIEHVMTTMKKLDIICAMPRGRNQHGLPSWVPDWSFKGPGSSFLENNAKHNFSAAGTSNAEARSSSDRSILYARGMHLGSINRIGAATEMEDLEDEKHAATAFRKWQKLLGWWGKHALTLGETLCRNIMIQQYHAHEIAAWMKKPDYLKWILGAFLRTVVLKSPGTKLDPRLAPFADYFPDWRFQTEDDVLGQVLFKGAVEMIFARRVFITDLHYMGIGPESMKEGDVVAIILGCQLPVVLRPEAGHHTYLGEAYVADYMYGNAMNGLADGKRELKDFEIY
jgi:Heterokaryon incompatibility protein (HET)